MKINIGRKEEEYIKNKVKDMNMTAREVELDMNRKRIGNRRRG
jgi:hypothetical protein